MGFPTPLPLRGASREMSENNQISEKELDIAIAFCKELFKAVYQLQGLLDELESLKT